MFKTLYIIIEMYITQIKHRYIIGIIGFRKKKNPTNSVLFKR